MRECPDCGASNGATDDFCGNCGGYLGWSDAATAAQTEPAPGGPEHPAPPAASTEAPARGAARSAPQPRQHTSAPAPGGTGPVPAPAEGDASTTAAGPGAPATHPLPPADADSPAPPASSPAPPRAAAPLPVKPARATAPRPVVRPTTADDTATGVPCPQCRTPNPPDRRFCRRCAAPLASAAVSTPLPWWRTVWPLRRRARGGSGRLVRLVVIIAVVMALCAGGFLLLPAGGI
ncbi:hypothetical protein [Streptomyces sp. RKAG290]|uniref:hypothetical protein n=1 Tax=Streptomyces sp. RKAG290 TaxID=2888348 RepID=UPI0020337B13|nr:hypothetical protein [Streptomyces sp. RKAG290]MCM2415347.1 hypothetical protein [Streptomyces sp. RKAG290]